MHIQFIMYNHFINFYINYFNKYLQVYILYCECIIIKLLIYVLLSEKSILLMLDDYYGFRQIWS